MKYIKLSFSLKDRLMILFFGLIRESFLLETPPSPPPIQEDSFQKVLKEKVSKKVDTLDEDMKAPKLEQPTLFFDPTPGVKIKSNLSLTQEVVDE